MAGIDGTARQVAAPRWEATANPRLYRAMELLGMTRSDLLENLRQEVYGNPCLELSVGEEEVFPEEDLGAEEGADEEDGSLEDDAMDDPEAEFDWEEIILGGFDAGGTRGHYEPQDYAEPAAVAVPDLHDHLEAQLALLQVEGRQQLAAWEIIGNIDDDGRLSCSLDDVAAGLRQRLDDFKESEANSGADSEPGDRLVPYQPEEVESALDVVQGLDPPGIAARDLRECLLIQLRRLRREDALAYRIVQERFDDLMNHRWTEITRALGLGPKEIQAAKDEIGELDPKPGRQLAGSTDHYIVPDMIVEKVGDEYMVFVNDAGMPRLRISPYYQDIVAQGKFKDENKKFITSRMNAAMWLMQVVEQRRRTMLAVARFIVERQHEFFEKGTQGLTPLTLREVAEEVEMSESTVSRVTSKKYVQTPRGVFSLKHFFSRGVAGDDGAVSTRLVKERIQSLVAGEDPKRPLTDQAIVDLLGHEGIHVARRTVGKYRTQLDIPVTRARRRY